MLHVPSVGPGVRYTARSVPLVQSSSHTDTSISNTHVYVGQVETAGVSNNVGWALSVIFLPLYSFRFLQLMKSLIP